MTNLEIIKYLANNNPDRLGALLEDIHCCAWHDGVMDKLGDESTLPLMTEWIYEDASTIHYLYKDSELEEWSNAINQTPDTIDFYDSISVIIPMKDPDFMCNNNNEFDYKEN